MGFLDALKGKKELAKGQSQKKEEPEPQAEGKYGKACSLCGAGNTEKKWMGQYWHKKCIRLLKKGAKRMV